MSENLFDCDISQPEVPQKVNQMNFPDGLPCELDPSLFNWENKICTGVNEDGSPCSKKVDPKCGSFCAEHRICGSTNGCPMTC